MRQLLLASPTQIGNKQIVEMCRIVDRVCETTGSIIDAEQVERAIARCDWREAPSCHVDPMDLTRPFEARFEVQRAPAFRPTKPARNQIESINGEMRCRTASTGRDPDLFVGCI